jgi:hypothetical protein
MRGMSGSTRGVRAAARADVYIRYRLNRGGGGPVQAHSHLSSAR